MGCWNGSCFLSNLPIHVGDDVVCFFIVESPGTPAEGAHNQLVGSDDLWGILGFPFQAKYNDYGYIEDIKTDKFTDITLNFLKNNLVELEQGKNPVHDHEVKKDELSFNSIDEWIHGGRLSIKNYLSGYKEYKNTLSISLIMMHKSVYDSLIDYADPEFEYVQKRLEEFKKNTIKYFLANDFEKRIAAEPNFIRGFGDTGVNSILISELSYKENLTETDATELTDKVYECKKFNNMTNALRKTIAPTCGNGSQTDAFDFHALLHKQSLKLLDEKIAERRRWSEE